MADKKKKGFNWRELRVGIFVIGSFIILIFMIFRVSGGRGFFIPKVTAVSYLPNTSGLKLGAKIKQDMTRYDRTIQEARDQIAALEKKRASAKPGEAVEVSTHLVAEENRLAVLQKTRRGFEEDLKTARGNLQNIRLALQIEKQYAGWIKRDSEVSIGSIGLLGDKYVDISIGRSDQAARKTPEGDIFIEGVSEATVRQLMVSANDLLANFSDISERVKSIVSKLDAGEGTIGQLINSDQLHASLVTTLGSLDNTVKSAGMVMTDIHESEGTVGSLLRDKTLYNELTSTTTELRQFVQRLNQSDGTVNKLIRDPELYNNLRDVSAKIDRVIARIDQGEGTLGKLTTDDAVFVETRDTLKRIRLILEQIDQGQGTLGQLLKDRQLYDNLNQALSELAKLVYDIRKNPKQYLRITFKLF
ncbi:MAG: ABC-type transport system involved in resistance to organic solvent, periplasmic component [Gemmatimonadetes bacterium]|nr:ABC-type transport system involved in resistance to organic solvent, periplasmic component [Gemmatimonadota bacterium]